MTKTFFTIKDSALRIIESYDSKLYPDVFKKWIYKTAAISIGQKVFGSRTKFVIAIIANWWQFSPINLKWQYYQHIKFPKEEKQIFKDELTDVLDKELK